MTVLSRLMERLSNYAALNAEVLPYFLQVEAFSKLNNAIGKVTLLVGCESCYTFVSVKKYESNDSLEILLTGLVSITKDMEKAQLFFCLTFLF